MKRTIDHALLDNAKLNKKDEFYTQREDIDRELVHYEKHFKNKVVFCNCDDFDHSHFARYFVENFERLGLKKLICACYKKEGSSDKAYYCQYTLENGKPSLTRTHFKGNGDFKSPESIALLDQADIVVTNPPFSLFRQFIALLVEHSKQFLVISNINAITYKEIFALIKANQAWLGVNLGRGISGFIVPEHYPLYGLETRINERGERIVSPNNCMWLTNLDVDKRHENIELVKTYRGNEAAYPRYDNYDGINVNRTKDIPKDYFGAMGVPITFLHKFNPEQFEIIKFRKGDDEKDLRINGKPTYFRILIKRKPTEEHA